MLNLPWVLRSIALPLLLAAGVLAAPLPLGILPTRAQGMMMGPSGYGGMTGPADQRFIVMMIPHHEGAIAMAELALTRARQPQLRALARRIQASQTEENSRMRSWYRQWFGSDVPAWSGSYGRGSYSGWGGCTDRGPGRGSGMGMMGATDLNGLRQATDFDRAFIEQMIPHHRMGVMMASMALGNTQHPELATLEQSIIRTQTAEIVEMEEWYRTWYPSR